MIVAITGTGMPFPRLIDALAEYARTHPSERVWVQAGASRLPPGLPGASLVPRAEILGMLRDCDVAVCHGGSGAIHDAMVTGHVPVVVPRRYHLAEHVNDHQLEIAAALEREDRAVVVHDVGALAGAIEKARALRATREPVRPGEALVAALRRDAAALTGRVSSSRRRRWSLVRALTVLVPIHARLAETDRE